MQSQSNLEEKKEMMSQQMYIFLVHSIPVYK